MAFALSLSSKKTVFVSGMRSIVELRLSGEVEGKFKTTGAATALRAFGGDELFVAYPAKLAVIDLASGIERVLREFSAESVLTSIALTSDTIFVADAGKRRVWRLPFADLALDAGDLPGVSGGETRISRDDKTLKFIAGPTHDGVVDGFVVPSPYFDVAIGGDDSLWVANTGRHELDNFTVNGRFRSFWRTDVGGLAGFLGCCNPAHFAVMSNGDFATAEKGVVRVKIYGPDGVFKCVVAPPAAFADGAGSVWRIDPSKRVQCGNCATECVLTPSAVKCVHMASVCGYCDLCSGYFQQNAKELETGAESALCPTNAIKRTFVEKPYFEYEIDQKLCVGCGMCVKGCGAFGNGSLVLQIRHDLCKNCNECEIAKSCPSGAIRRVSATKPSLLPVS